MLLTDCDDGGEAFEVLTMSDVETRGYQKAIQSLLKVTDDIYLDGVYAVTKGNAPHAAAP